MLIRNVNSLFELENLKKQQATILQLQIDNEAIKEKRVADFKNPNKPPPMPEQYKTSSEIQKDVMAQQKITIDHLKSLGLDNFLASQVAIDMSQLAEGDGAFFKFNSYFPAFKKKIENNRNLKSLVKSSQIIEVIEKFFIEIDESTGLSVDSSTSTNFFNNDTNFAVDLLPSKELLGEILGVIRMGVQKYEDALVKQEVESISALIEYIYKNSPNIEEIRNIETLPNIEKTFINKNINFLLARYNFPSTRKLIILLDMINGRYEGPAKAVGVDENFGLAPDDFEEIVFAQKTDGELERYKKFITILSRLFSNFDDKAEKKFSEVVGLIQGVGAGIQQNMGRLDVGNKDNQLKFITNQIKVASQNYLARNIENFSRNDEQYFPEDEGYDANSLFDEYYFLSPPTIDGKPPNGSNDADDNIIYEPVKVVKNRKTFTGEAFLRNGQRIRIHNGQFQLLNEFNAGRWLVGGNPLLSSGSFENPSQLMRINEGKESEFNISESKYKEDDNISSLNQYLLFVREPDREPEMRYSKAELEKLILAHELPNLKLKLDKDPNYQPLNRGETRFYSERNEDDEPVMTGNTQGWGVKPKKAKKKSKKDSESSSDEEKSVHIDINSHNGKNYKMSGDGFIKRRIKIGKGLEVRNDEPKFRQFGKYIIHMPQLRNNNVLNLKHKSGGSIPSIKPVHVEDNYKDFIIDILDSGRVNDRHYKTLTEPEQNHFLKAVRGAGIMSDLKLKTSNHDKEQEEIKRLELLIGEVNAGNDNAGILKEARTLIKKYVSNGRISRQKGLDMLFELE